MRYLLTIFVLCGLMMAGAGTASAVSPRGDCSCTEQPPLCDPDKFPVFADNRYFTDEGGVAIVMQKEMWELCTDEEGCHSD